MKKVCISLVTFNNHEQTKACLESLDALSLQGVSLQVVVVDNASREKFYVSKKEYKRFTLEIIRSKTNSGFAGGNNQGITYGLTNGCDYIMVLNNDTLVDKNLLQELLGVFDKNVDAGAVVPKIYFASGHEFHKDRYKKSELGKVIWYAGGEMDWNNIYGKHIGVDDVDTGQFAMLKKTELLTGCCVLFSRAALEQTGLFDERYFLYYEDADISMRLKKHNFSIYFVPTACIWHINAGSTGGSGSRLQDYYLTRNRLLFGFTYASIRTKFALGKEAIRMLLSGREWQRNGVRDFFTTRLEKGSYPV